MSPRICGAALLIALAVALVLPGSRHGRLASRLGPAANDLGISGGRRMRIPRWMRGLRGGRARRTADRAAALEACEVLAAELRAGRPPLVALETAFGASDDRAPLPSRAPDSLVGNHDPSLDRSFSEGHPLAAGNDQARADPLRPVAVAWRVAEHTGAGLAGVVDRVVFLMREEESVRQEVSAQLAGPRATAKLLAALPVLGLLLGSGFGAGPIRFLFATPIGLACLVTGILLAVMGARWVERLARRAERFE